MPGVYSKPPRRAEFASDIHCIIETATECLQSGGKWDAYVHTLVEEIEAERGKARQEISPEYEEKEVSHKSGDSIAQRTKFRQLVARKEVEVAEVFFECGVHRFFCKLLEKVEHSMNPVVFERILGVGPIVLQGNVCTILEE